MQLPRVPTALGPALAKLGIPRDPGGLVYIIGRETLVVNQQGRMGWITEPLFALLARNARSMTYDFSLPAEQVVELGIQLDL
jgi:KUP system potassium uptake protein